MYSGHPAGSARPRDRGDGGRAAPRPPVSPPGQAAPAQACCCPAKPRFKVTMPVAGGRAQPADLWLCGHHYRASRVTLVLANAQVEEHNAPDEHQVPVAP